MKTQIPNINMVRSAWRRVKKDIKDAIIRDLKPVKDVKGAVLRANPNPPQAAWAPRAPQAGTNKDKSHHRSIREIVIQIRHNRSTFLCAAIRAAVVR
jgi:hypothetical protein